MFFTTVKQWPAEDNANEYERKPRRMTIEEFFGEEQYVDEGDEDDDDAIDEDEDDDYARNARAIERAMRLSSE
jgi:hypothetical protein